MARAILRFGLAFAACCPSLSVAQTIPPATPLSTVDQAIPSREQVNPSPPPQPPASSVSVDSSAAFRRPDCPFADSAVRLTLTKVVLARPDGAPLQRPIAKALAGLDRPAGDQRIDIICSIRDQANALLARAGYIASVQVPQQRITDGVLRLSVVTARITEVRVRGEPGPYRALLERRIAALRKLDPLNQRRVERLLLLTGDIPGLTIQLSLRPAGTAPGDVIGELTITFHRFAVTAAIQNVNSHALGPTTVYARAELYGLTGHADLTYLGLSSTTDFHEQVVVQAGHVAGLGRGVTAGARFTYAWSRPDLGALTLRTDTLIAGGDLIVPVVRSINANLRGALGVDYVNQRTAVGTGANATPLNADKLRTLFGRVSGDVTRRGSGASPFSSVTAGVELRKGLDILGATRPLRSFSAILPSRIDGDSRAFVVRADMDAVLGVGPVSLLAGARAQWADRPLLAYDEFSLGNLTIGRGYDPGSNSGDRAIGLRTEVRVNPPVARKLAPQLFAFTDVVKLTNLDIGSIEVNRRLRSVGGGLRMVIARSLAAEVIYARPLDRALLINRSPPPGRLLLSLFVQVRGRARR